MSSLYGGASPYNTKDSFKIPSGSEMGKPTLCKKRKGWATLSLCEPQMVRHSPTTQKTASKSHSVQKWESPPFVKKAKDGPP